MKLQNYFLLFFLMHPKDLLIPLKPKFSFSNNYFFIFPKKKYIYIYFLKIPLLLTIKYRNNYIFNFLPIYLLISLSHQSTTFPPIKFIYLRDLENWGGFKVYRGKGWIFWNYWNASNSRSLHYIVISFLSSLSYLHMYFNIMYDFISRLE